MTLVSLTFKQRKWIKCYWKTKNVTEVQRRRRNEFGTPPPTRVKVTNIRDQFEICGTMQNMNNVRS